MPDDLPEDLPLAAALAAWVAHRCGLDAGEIDRDCPLVELGISSVDAVELAGRLELRLGRPLPPTLLWEHPTINAIVRAMTTAPAKEKPYAGTAAPQHQAVAVIGLGCRFPGGADNPERLWRLLMDGRDAVRTVPPDRWQRRSGGDPLPGSAADLLRGPGRWGGFLDDVARFDAGFFGIAAGEARLMDPQQRLLLEVAWDALAHAALDPAALRGSRTGVYVGICASEYAHLTTAVLERVEGWTATGGALSIAANRLSYLLDARGPSLAVDTACSSSLVAIHLAARDLRSGETDLALAAGVSLMLDPALTVAFGRAGGIAAGGRCRPFSADADGIVRGEGGGVVVLKRLTDAVRDGDRVLAVLRGGAMNSDGRSNGLVAPNPRAQEALLRRAYADAGCPASTVDYVEAHGTGTPLGDPIEAGALGAVCGAGRPADGPLLIGSVKSRLGHLEAAAGVAGFITAVLALHHGTVPHTLHASRTNPHIPLAEWGLRVPVAAEPLPSRDRPARAGVSAFGFGGTNAHLVLEAFPPDPSRADDIPDRPAVCVIADRDPDRVRDQAGTLAAWLTAGPGRYRPEDVAGTLARRGERGPARAVVVARDIEALVAGLSAAGAGRAHPTLALGGGNRAAEGGVWVFSGYGAHWPGMGRVLLETEPAFADAVDELAPAFRAELGLSLRDALCADTRLSVARAQPVTFGLQVALAALWHRYGLRPAAVLGHSMGEVAAAVVAGALSPVDGVRLIAARARLLARVGPGAMAVMELSEEELGELVGDLPQVSVAVLAAPRQLVVTGPPDAVAALTARAAAHDRAVHTVTTEGAGHSPAVDALLPELHDALRGLRPREPKVPFYSTVRAGTPALDAGYWLANLRQPVRLADAVRRAAHAGFGFFLEISPHPVLLRPIGQTLAAAGSADPLVTGTLRRDDPDAFGRSLATLCANGHRVPATPATILDLPTPPWRGERHWIEEVPAIPDAPPNAAGPALLGELLGVAWREQPAPPAGEAGPVTLLGEDGDPLVDAILTNPVVSAGVGGPVVSPGVGGPVVSAGLDDPAAPIGVRRAALDEPPPDRDLVLIAPPAGALPDPAAALRFAGWAVRAAATGAPRLWLVTRGGASVGAAEPGAPDLAWVRGLVRTLAFEQPLTRTTWLDLDPAEEPATQAARLRSELAATGGDDEVAWRTGQRWAARLTRVPAPARRSRPPVRAGAAYLITGGYGGLGLRVAQWLAAAGAGRLVLTGRSGPAVHAEQTIDALRRSGVDVRVLLGDLADDEMATRLVAAADAELTGVVHAAGVLRDGLVSQLDPGDLAEVWAPKVRGAWRLHTAVVAAGAELDWWVTFSSAAALLGSPGQVAYATANAWLDAFARWQRAHGVPATSINWGTWSGLGGAAGVRLPGLDPIEPDEGIAALAGLLSRNPCTVGALHFDPAAALAVFPEAGRLPFFAELTAAGALRAAAAPSATAELRAAGALTAAPELAAGALTAAPAPGGTWPPATKPGWPGAERIRALPPAEAVRVIGDRLAHHVAAVLGMPQAPPPDAPLVDAGLDSLAAIRIKSLVELDLGTALPTAALVRGATLADLTTALTTTFGITPAERPAPPSARSAEDALPEAGPTPAATSAAGVGARDAAERAAILLFETVLGHPVPGIGWRAAVPPEELARIAEAARTGYGAHVHLAELLADPTPRALAVPLRAAEHAEIATSGPVRPLRAAGGSPPLFLAHPAGGSTFVYRQLAELLGPDQPVYGLERLGDAGPVPERAARYAGLIREMFPAGPYRLGGWSFGGVLAYETARLLVAAGAQVDALVLIDAGLPAPVSVERAAQLLTERFLGFLRYLGETYRVPVEVAPDRLRGLPGDEQFGVVLAEMGRVGLTGRLPPAVLRHQIDSHWDTRALDDYLPGPYRGPVTLYRCTQPTPWAVRDPRYEHADAARGWDRCCADLRIVPVTGHHLNLLDPPAVDTIAADLRRLL